MSKGFKGMPGNMQAIMQQAKKMQEQLQKAQENSKFIEEEFSAGGGMVKVKVNGENKVLAITINPEAVNPKEVELLQDLLLAAINGALSSAQEKVQQELSKVTGGLNIPGMM